MRRLERHRCNTCGEDNLSMFAKNKVKASGLQGTCKACMSEIRRKRKNESDTIVKKIYDGQRSSSRKRGHQMPTYSLEEFIAWAFENNFEELYNEFKRSGYQKSLRPSADRLNDEVGYSLDNIQLITWGENLSKETERQSKPVIQMTMEGEFIKEWKSARFAQRQLGVNNISCACSGRYDSAGGFKWSYKKS